jgi:hypothetical protein
VIHTVAAPSTARHGTPVLLPQWRQGLRAGAAFLPSRIEKIPRPAGRRSRATRAASRGLGRRRRPRIAPGSQPYVSPGQRAKTRAQVPSPGSRTLRPSRAPARPCPRIWGRAGGAEIDRHYSMTTLPVLHLTIGIDADRAVLQSEEQRAHSRQSCPWKLHLRCIKLDGMQFG